MLSRHSVLFLLCMMLSRFGVYQAHSAGFKARPLTVLRGLLSASTSTYTRSSPLHVEVSASPSFAFEGDLLVVPFVKPKSKKDDLVSDLKNSIPSGLPKGISATIADILDENNFKADANSKRVVRLDKYSNVKYLALVGLGSTADYQSSALGRSVLDISKDLKLSSVAVAASTDLQSKDIDELLIGLHDAAYNDDRFRKEPEGGHPKLALNSVKLLGVNKDARILKDIQEQSAALASGVHFAKDLVGQYEVLSIVSSFYSVLQELLQTTKHHLRLPTRLERSLPITTWTSRCWERRSANLWVWEAIWECSRAQHSLRSSFT